MLRCDSIGTVRLTLLGITVSLYYIILYINLFKQFPMGKMANVKSSDVVNVVNFK